MSFLATSTPEARHDGKNKWVNDDCVRDRKKAVSSDAVDQGRYRDYGVCRIKISAHQKPGYQDAEPLTPQCPLVEPIKISCFPARRHESKHGDEQEKDDK